MEYTALASVLQVVVGLGTSAPGTHMLYPPVDDVQPISGRKCDLLSISTLSPGRILSRINLLCSLGPHSVLQ